MKVKKTRGRCFLFKVNHTRVLIDDYSFLKNKIQ